MSLPTAQGRVCGIDLCVAGSSAFAALEAKGLGVPWSGAGQRAVRSSKTAWADLSSANAWISSTRVRSPDVQSFVEGDHTGHEAAVLLICFRHCDTGRASVSSSGVWAAKTSSQRVKRSCAVSGIKGGVSSGSPLVVAGAGSSSPLEPTAHMDTQISAITKPRPRHRQRTRDGGCERPRRSSTSLITCRSRMSTTRRSCSLVNTWSRRSLLHSAAGQVRADHEGRTFLPCRVRSDRHGEEVHVVALDVSISPIRSDLRRLARSSSTAAAVSRLVEEAGGARSGLPEVATGKGLVHHRNKERLLAPDPTDVAAVIDVQGRVSFSAISHPWPRIGPPGS